MMDGRITLSDDPLLPGNPGYAPFDLEGMPTMNIILVKDGVINSYLHNLSTAKKFGVKSTGHAGFIVPLPHSLIISSKENHSLEELFKEIRNGIFVTNVWYTRFQNYSTGDLSTLQRDVAFQVKDGNFIGIVRGMRISDNIVRMFSNIIGMSNEAEWVRWWDYDIPSRMPYIGLTDVNITTGL